MQQKTDFLRSEVYNLTRSDRLKQRLKGNLSETRVMESPEIIRNTTQEFENSDSDESDTEIEYITVTQTSTVTIVEEETKSPSIESHNKIEPNSEEETNGSSIESHDISAEPKAEKESKSYTVEPHNNIAVPKIEDDNVEAYGLLSPKAQVEQEIEYWRNKVSKMIDLSQSSLETESKPFLDTIIGDLKDRISANFTKLQQENYLRYKVMAEMISSIDKDSETLITTKEIILSPEVDRQMMRDRISEAREAVENSMKDVELVLNEAHGIIMEKYFEVAQNTIDVLESFADTKILEFSNSLSGLLTILENNVDFEDEISWNAWKEFHKIKESIFNARDKILDEAHTYKLQPRGSIKPRALEPWALYLDNINFHIRFLLSDNDDYLKLVRAKANVAYQMREGLTRQLEEIQEQAAQEKAAQEKAEQEKAEQEQAAQEKAEQEKAEQDAQEKAEQEKSEQENLEQENLEQENLEQENLEQEKAEREEAEREKAEREEAEREKAVQQETPQEKAAQQEEEEQKKSNNPGSSTSIAMSVESSNKETDSVSDIGSATLEAIAVNTQVPEAIAQSFSELSKEEDNTDAENIPEVTCSPILETATVSSPSQSTHSEAENQILGAHDQLDVSNSADYEPIEADEYLEAGEADEAF
ncbi:putative outer spore wall assembly protein [Clavispora lusitaniae]|uniref:Outer spore wall assembly protein n=1 Tax=Clavispora lusitaniae TaxID=36911 RepID=A0AA91Q087_CLALS|nr:putative outer spore wall assembly protein [Clavispora lusitaniae]